MRCRRCHFFTKVTKYKSANLYKILHNPSSFKIVYKPSVKTFFILYTIYPIFVIRKNTYLRTCESFKSAKMHGSTNSKFTNYKSANYKKKIGSANRKSAKWHISGRSANRTNYLSPHVSGFAIYGTYLRTGHFCLFKIKILKKISIEITSKNNHFVYKPYIYRFFVLLFYWEIHKLYYKFGCTYANTSWSTCVNLIEAAVFWSVCRKNITCLCL